MNEVTVLPRVTFTNPFVVKVLDVWRVKNECEMRTKSKVIVGWQDGTVSDSG